MAGVAGGVESFWELLGRFESPWVTPVIESFWELLAPEAPRESWFRR